MSVEKKKETITESAGRQQKKKIGKERLFFSSDLMIGRFPHNDVLWFYLQNDKRRN